MFIKAHRGPAKRIAGPQLCSVCPLSPPYLTLRPLCVCLQLCSSRHTEGPANHAAFCTAANNTLHNLISGPVTFEHIVCTVSTVSSCSSSLFVCLVCTPSRLINGFFRFDCHAWQLLKSLCNFQPKCQDKIRQRLRPQQIS